MASEAAEAIIEARRSRRILAPLGLTYPQYLVMLVLWEQEGNSTTHHTLH